jgi:hypothetical protein
MPLGEGPDSRGSASSLGRPDQVDRVLRHGVSTGPREFARKSRGLLQSRGGGRGVGGHHRSAPFSEKNVLDALPQLLVIGADDPGL